MDWTGETIADRYVVERKLDAGGMGTVYLARDEGVRGRQVVVKVPHPKLLTPEFRRRFEIEIDQLVALEHPHVVHVYGAGTHNDVPYLAVQYLAGGDLNARIRAKLLTPEEVLPWLHAIASALDHAHRNGCIHRDVKPGNIIFDAEGHAYLSDFGIATVVSSAEASDEGLTQAGTFLGSIPYLPPEAMAREFAPPYDQYSLALVVYHALSGRMAFEGDTTRAILEAKVAGEAVSLDLRVAGLPEGLVAAVMRAIEVAPRSRFASCRDFADAFETGLRGGVSEPRTRPAALPGSTPAATALRSNTRPIPLGSVMELIQANIQYVALGSAAILLLGLLVWLIATPPAEGPEPALDPELPVAAVESELTAPESIAPSEPTAPESIAATEPTAPESIAPTEPTQVPPEPEVSESPEPPVPVILFAERDATLFSEPTVGAEVLGLIAAGTRVAGLPAGAGWTRLADAEAGEGFVRASALGSVSAEPPDPPARRVALVPATGSAPEFRIDTREVPVSAYQTCVAAGACSAPAKGPGCRSGGQAGEALANCLSAAQAGAFCAWAGKRLPSESEWLRGAAEPGTIGFSGGVAEWTSSPSEGGNIVRESPTSRFVAAGAARLPGVGFRCAAG